MSSPQQILGDQCDHTMKRLGITSADWWKKVGECEGDATKVKAWVDEMEAMTTEDTANAVADAVIADVVTDVVAVDAVKDVEDAVIADVVADVVAADAVKDAVAAVVADVVAADADEDVVAVPAPTPKPKRAKSAWTVYFTANRAEFKLKNPDIASKDIMGALGKIWKTLDDESKAPFIKISEDDKIRYKKEMETYIPDPSATTKKTKAKKAKKAKKIKTPKCSKQCIARKFSLVGDKQCSKACVSDTHDFCKRCQTHADNYDGKCGPALWKYCHDNGISRENTKSKGTPGQWFGRIDDTESEFDYPGSSFVSTEGVRVVVLAFPKNENHDAVSTWQISENAILAHDTTLKENWPKKYHKLGHKAKKTKTTKSKTKVVVETSTV